MLKSTLFFKQRVLWLPKAWVAVLLLLLVSLVTLIGLRNIALYLAINQPNHGDYLVVEGWQSEPSLQQALALFQSGDYHYLITTGGPDKRQVNPEFKTYAEQSAAFLRTQGLDKTKLIIIPAPASAQDRTFLSAVMVRERLVRQNNASISMDVYTQSVHARRSHTLYQMAFRQGDSIGIYASAPENYDLRTWWKTSEGAKSVVTEVAGLLWVKCCFKSSKQGSHQEKWGLVKNQR